MSAKSSEKILSQMFKCLFFHDLSSVSKDLFSEMGKDELFAFEGDGFGDLGFEVACGEKSEFGEKFFICLVFDGGLCKFFEDFFLHGETSSECFFPDFVDDFLSYFFNCTSSNVSSNLLAHLLSPFRSLGFQLFNQLLRVAFLVLGNTSIPLS